MASLRSGAHTLGRGDLNSEPDEIRVDIDSVADFAAALRHELEANLRPQLVDLTHRYRLGVNVGNGLGTPNALAVRQRYQLCLSSIIEQFEAITQGSAVLADAAERIVAQYRDADALNSATVAAVQDAIDNAARAAGDPALLPPEIPSPVSNRWAV